MKNTKTFLLAVLGLSLAVPLAAQDMKLSKGTLTTPLPYFDDYEQGYVVLRDGNKIEGTVSIKQYEKQNKMDVTDASGTKYKFNVRSLKEWGLSINIPENKSPLSYYDWKNDKRKQNSEPERGFVQLNSGETLEGKILIEGESSDSPLAGNNFFAIESLTFVDESGIEKEYLRKDIKAFGRILPWDLAPKHLIMSGSAEIMGKTKTKKTPGFVITNEGERIEGDIQLVVKNSMKVDSKIKSDLIDEIYIDVDGSTQKLGLDDIYAYGLTDLTINKITNNQDIKYTIEEMNFHPGTLKTKDGNTKKGYLAYFPTPGNYYGVYFAENLNAQVDIVPFSEIADATQEISLIEAFSGYGMDMPTSKNTNTNGYIVDLSGRKYNGTISLVNDNDWWAKSINFVDEDNNKISYGGNEAQPITYFVLDGTMYVQNKDVFVKTEGTQSPLTLLNNPYVDNSNKLGNMAMGMVADQVASNIGDAVASQTVAFQMSTGIDLSKLDDNGNNGLSTAYNIGNAATSGLSFLANQAINGTGKEPKLAKKGKDYNVFNSVTGELSHADGTNWEYLLEGCLVYLKAGKNEQKEIKDYDDVKMQSYLNTCYK
ncbi:hypothetical protein N7E81_18445 [Reichenbachiella carrageenanivorans]|uniref:Uncharacterized protein n=1 Tax=Reichenbachiella carrageenanivorans TaxID=2979869 RepID=A0ABY6CZI8_9BACT|nr:hypothetical protein [Reichenbachiella carrageenanivorans]UXX79336.1 hypothetical protein N7E81_18445 [Reichenbachiella carrageenanivorans]